MKVLLKHRFYKLIKQDTLDNETLRMSIVTFNIANSIKT